MHRAILYERTNVNIALVIHTVRPGKLEQSPELHNNIGNPPLYWMGLLLPEQWVMFDPSASTGFDNFRQMFHQDLDL